MPHGLRKRKTKEKTLSDEELIAQVEVTEPPKLCDLCGKAIEMEDEYYVGKDAHGIWAWTCDSTQCYKWLKYKKKFKIPYEEKG